jgi:hypothetical protein
MQAIDELHTGKDTIDIKNSDTFVAIVAYFKTLLLNVCSDNNVQFNILYLIFVVSDSWKVETNNIIQQIMMPLLTKVGIHFDTEDNRDRVLFMSTLETYMTYFQLGKHRTSLSFIHNENRRIMYNLYDNGQLVKLKATYFQVKEDYNLRMFNEKYFSLNIISMHEITTYDMKELENGIKNALKQFILDKLLKMGHLITTLNDDWSGRGAAESILKDILFSFWVYLHIFYK